MYIYKHIPAECSMDIKITKTKEHFPVVDTRPNGIRILFY